MKLHVSGSGDICLWDDKGDFAYWLLEDGILTRDISKACTSANNRGRNVEKAQKFLDSWLPQKEPLTREQVKEAADVSDECALACSINHWKQILLAGYENVGPLKKFNYSSGLCAMCKRSKFHERGGCSKCLLYQNGAGCCEESSLYKKASDTSKEDFVENTVNMLNGLQKIYNKLFGETKMKEIEIKGKKFSEDTIVEALKKHCGFKTELSYEERQAQWIKDNNVKAGDRVKAVRIAESYEDGWRNVWILDMNETLKISLTIKRFTPDNIHLSDGYGYPYFVLEKVIDPEPFVDGDVEIYLDNQQDIRIELEDKWDFVYKKNLDRLITKLNEFKEYIG